MEFSHKVFSTSMEFSNMNLIKFLNFHLLFPLHLLQAKLSEKLRALIQIVV